MSQGINVRLKFLGSFRDLFLARERTVTLTLGAVLRDLFAGLCDSAERRLAVLTDGGEIRPDVVVLINGIPWQSAGGMEARLGDGDTVAVFPFLGGG